MSEFETGDLVTKYSLTVGTHSIARAPRLGIVTAQDVLGDPEYLFIQFIDDPGLRLVPQLVHHSRLIKMEVRQ